MSVGQKCQSKWSHLRPLLRPTQASLGFAWVYRIMLEDMGKKKDAQDTMDGKVVPVALANGVAYVVDHHHHLAALDLSGFDTVDVTLFIACDFSGTSSSKLWTELASRGWAYLYGRPPGSPDALPTPIAPDMLPSSIGFREGNVTMVDDRWRSLSGFSRKIDSCPGCSSSNGGSANHNYGCRAYERICTVSGTSIAFYEYRWAFFFDDAATSNRTLWSNATAAYQFRRALAALRSPSPSHPTKDVSDWSDAAALIVPLARSDSAWSYRVPSFMGAMAGWLPGHRHGMSPYPDPDPNCDPPTCGHGASL